MELELNAARLEELAEADLQISLSGDPIFNHDIKAEFLGGFLSKTQSLINALAQAAEQMPTGHGRIAKKLVEEYGLLVGSTFPSSFGLRLRLRSKSQSGSLRLSQMESVLDQFCTLMDSNLSQGDLVNTVSSQQVKTHYCNLIKSIAKEGAQVTVRTKARLNGVRINARQAYDRASWVESLTEATATLRLDGVLTGGSVATKRFELQVAEKFYRGRISPEAKIQMKDLKLGEHVNAEVIETVFVAGEVAVQGHATYFLKRIAKAS